MELGIFEAIRDNNLELVGTFPNVNITHPDNYSALMVACEEADLPIVQDLIARGATINTFNDYGNSPLTLAAFYGRDDIVQELLNHGALIDAMSPQGTWTALMAACHQNRLSTVRLLLDAGADIDLDNINDQSALYYAHNAGHQEIEQELAIRGALPLLEPQQPNAGAEDDDEMPALAPGPAPHPVYGIEYADAIGHPNIDEMLAAFEPGQLMQFGIQPPGPVPVPRAAEVLPPEESNNPFARRFQCSACLTNAVNTRLNPCGHLICSECFV